MNLKNQEEFLELILKNGLSPEIQVAVLLENLDTVFDKGTIRARIVKFKLQKYMKSQDICEKTYALLMIVSDGKAIDSIPKQEEIKDKYRDEYSFRRFSVEYFSIDIDKFINEKEIKRKDVYYLIGNEGEKIKLH